MDSKGPCLQEQLPAASPTWESAGSVSCPQGGHGHWLGKFYMITGVGSDPQQPSALPGPLSSHPCFWARLCTAAVFSSLPELQNVADWWTRLGKHSRTWSRWLCYEFWRAKVAIQSVAEIHLGLTFQNLLVCHTDPSCGYRDTTPCLKDTQICGAHGGT